MVDGWSFRMWLLAGLAALTLVACGGEPAPRVVGVSIDQRNVEVGVGETVVLSAAVEVVGGAGTGVVWSSEDDAVATVGPASGEVAGVSPGVVGITATSAVDASKSASVSVTVTAEPVDTTNRVVIGAVQEPGVLGDLLSVADNRAITAEVNGWLFAGLYRVGLDGTLEPDLVTELASTANGRMVIGSEGDGKRVELTLTLREGLAWSDGTPITTGDLEFVAEVAAAMGLRPWERFGYETIDARNFRVTVSDAQAVDLVSSLMPVLPAHVLRPAWDAAVAAGSPLADVFAEFGSATSVNEGRLVSSGPFEAVEWEPGVSVTMARNPRYHDHPVDGGAYAQVVEYRFIAGACVEAYDELRDQAVAELDLTASLPLYQEMQQLFAEELMAIPLLFLSNPLVTADGLVNFVTSTFSTATGYPPARPALVGWADRGAVKVVDQADYALQR